MPASTAFSRSEGLRVAYAGGEPYHISYPGAAGWYFVRVFTSANFNVTQLYTLRVTYP